MSGGHLLPQVAILVATISCTWTYNEETGVFNVNYGYGKGDASVSTVDGKPVLTWMETNYDKVG